jgi:TRAP-type C4-dicarboxylate transport system permease small subunit
MKILQRMEKLLGRVEGALLVLFLTVMVVLTFLQIVLRAFHTYGHFQWANSAAGYIDWAEPLVRLLVLWVALLGASLITGENKHIKIDLMSELLPARWLPYRELVLTSVCVVVTALMTEASWSYVRLERSFGGSLFLGMPTWIAQIILPAGFFLMLCRFGLRGIGEAARLLEGRRR